MQGIEVGPSVDGTLDTLAMVTVDNSGVYSIEVMTNLFDIGERAH